MRTFNLILAGCAGVGLGNTKADAVILTLIIYWMLQCASRIGKKYWGEA